MSSIEQLSVTCCLFFPEGRSAASSIMSPFLDANDCHESITGSPDIMQRVGRSPLVFLLEEHLHRVDFDHQLFDADQ